VKRGLFEFVVFFVVGDFSAVFAEFVQQKLFRGFHLIFLRDVIAVLTNHANESYFDSVFSFFSHTSDYTLSEAEFK
jgi:hypothetical protein